MFQRVQREGRPALVLFLTAGFPDMDATTELVPDLAQAGADAIELGVPFSDPLADGPTIQASSFHALKQGVTLGTCIQMVGQLRSQVLDTPLILFGYYNPFLSYGLRRFAQDAQQAGVDGVIVPDLPPEESIPLMDECLPRDIHVIPLLAPSSTDPRIEKTCHTASGFIYCVSLTGVTGAREELPAGLDQFLDRLRRHTNLPLAVGFGISRREHVEALGGKAQAAVVGSALINLFMDTPRAELVARAREYVQGLRHTVASLEGGRGR